MLSAGENSNSHTIFKLKLHNAKKQDKNKMKCMGREKALKKKGIKILTISSVFILL